MTKSKLILNPDYYSAHAYMVEETEEDKKTILIKVVMKLLMTILIIGALVLVYNYYIKNNFTKISTWLTNKKELFFPEMKTAIIIREEISVSAKVKKIVPTIKIKKDEPIVVPSGSSKNNELSDEYLKLMQESLVNY
jgi:hypothetical protein